MLCSETGERCDTADPGVSQDQLQRSEPSAAVPLGLGLVAGLPAKGDSAFAKASRPPVRLGGCQPQLPSAGVSAFASYPVRSDCCRDIHYLSEHLHALACTAPTRTKPGVVCAGAAPEILHGYMYPAFRGVIGICALTCSSVLQVALPSLTCILQLPDI